MGWYRPSTVRWQRIYSRVSFIKFPFAASCRGHDIGHSAPPGLQGNTVAIGNFAEEKAMRRSVASSQQLIEARTLTAE